MGTDVIVRCNHKICFLEKTQNTLATEVLEKLNSAEYFGLGSFFDSYFDKNNISGNKVIYKARSEDEYYSFEKDGYIEVESTEVDSLPHLDIDPHQCNFLVPFRYRTWCVGESSPPNDWRAEWRKYLWITISALGGDRAIYLADNAHPLESFDYSAPINEIEAALLGEFGPPAASLSEAFENTGRNKSIYYIDCFQDIKNA